MMLYPWPLADLHPTLNESLEIAMDYLAGTGQSYPYWETQVKAGRYPGGVASGSPS